MPMSVSTTNRIVLGLASFALVTVIFMTVRGAEQPTRTRAEFMRLKLDYSKNLLEGITLENFDAIIKNARALKRLSEAAEWEVPTIPDASSYIAFTSEFQQIADELVLKAKDKNIDGAALGYFRLTMNCVKCHKYVRLIAK
jgi:hypothetical protein